MTRQPVHKHSILKSYRPMLDLLEDRLVPAGTWTQLANLAPLGSNGIGTMELLSDGTIMAQGGGVTNTWYRLTPDANGSYQNGTWSTLASMGLERLYTGTRTLQDGRVFVLGGEYSGPAGNATWTNTGEIYNPLTNSWTNIPNFPRSAFGDGSTGILPDGRVLASYLSGPETYIYNPTTNSWSNGPTKLDGDRSNEETWVQMPDGSILTYNIFNNPNHAQRMDPSTMTWIDSGTMPVSLFTTSGSEVGGGVLLPDKRVFMIGGNSNTAIYTPSAVPGGPGSWVAGPVIPGGLGANDAPCCVMPNGKVILAVGGTPAFSGPTKIYEFDPLAPIATSLTDVTPTTPNLNSSLPYTTRMLLLPTGQVLFTDSTSRLSLYTPAGGPLDAWRPVISGISSNGAGTFTLTGTQINGIFGGGAYGDDAEMDTNYPIVKLTNASGGVYYARTFNWSSTGVATGSTPVSTNFTLPSGIPIGTYTLTVIGSGIESLGVPFNVDPVPPIGNADNYVVNEDTALVRSATNGVLSNDTDVFGLPLSAILVSGPSHGTVTLNSNGSFTYIPSLNSNDTNNPGPDSFTYKANNGYFDSTPVTVTISVTPVNDAPTAVDDGVLPIGVATYLAHPGIPMVIPSGIGVLANDLDPEIQLGEGGLPLTAALATSPVKGVVNSFSSNGGFTYTAAINSTGNDSFQYRANDGLLNSNTANVKIHINNYAQGKADQYYTPVGVAVSGNVLSNDTDLDLDALTANILSSPSNGTVSFNSNGTFTYTPNPGFFGIDTFTYAPFDSWDNGTTATVTIRVDRLPVVMSDSYSIKKDTVLEVFYPGILSNDSDPDTAMFGDVLQSHLVTTAAHGTVIMDTNGYLKYTPNAGYYGPDSFTYTASDGYFNGNTATISINVQPTPIALPDSYAVFGSVLNVSSPTGVLVNDNSPNNNLLSARLNTAPANGAVLLKPDGSFIYTAGNGFIGVDTFTYVANDGFFDSNVATVTVVVFAPNQPPVAVDDNYAVPSDVTTTIPARGVLNNDYDPDGPSSALIATLLSGTSNGTLFLYPDGHLTYTPQAGFNGYDSFTYQCSDGNSLSNIATVKFTVGTPPPPPTDPYRRVVLGKEIGGALKVFAGETGNSIFTITPYGASFTGAIRVATGDLNGDGVPDIVTAPGPQTGTGTGLTVKAFNGVTGAPLTGNWTNGVAPFGANYRGGIEIAVGDVNGDGKSDVVTSADSVTASPQVRSYNGSSGTLFSSSAWYSGFNPYTGSAFGGVRVALGDVNGDGRTEIVTSPGAGTPTVKVYSTAATTFASALIKSFVAYSSSVAGGVYVSVGDLDGDGKAEIVTGAATNSNGQVRIFNGNGTTPVRNLAIAGTTTGPARVAIGDINGDGKLDLVVGIASSGAASRARIYDALTLSEMFGTTLFNYGGGYTGGVFVAALPKAKSGVVTT